MLVYTVWQVTCNMDAKGTATCTRSGRGLKIPPHLRDYALENRECKKARRAVKAQETTAEGLSSALPIDIFTISSNLDTGARTNSAKSNDPFEKDLSTVLCESAVASRVKSAPDSILDRSGSTDVGALPTLKPEFSRLPSGWLCNPVSSAS